MAEYTDCVNQIADVIARARAKKMTKRTKDKIRRLVAQDKIDGDTICREMKIPLPGNRYIINHILTQHGKK